MSCITVLIWVTIGYTVKETGLAPGAVRSDGVDLNDLWPSQLTQIVGASDESTAVIWDIPWTGSVIPTLLDPDAAQSKAWAANNHFPSAVVGEHTPVEGSTVRPVLWERYAGTNVLPTLGGSGGSVSGSARDINDARLIVGWCSADSTNQTACQWSPTSNPGDFSVSALGDLGGGLSAATAVNQSGQGAGWSETAAGGHHACAWGTGWASPGWTAVDLHTGPGASEATDINNHGSVVGTVAFDDGHNEAFRSQPGYPLEMLPAPAGSTTWEANGINDYGVTVGWGNDRAVVWLPGHPQPLDLTPQILQNPGYIVDLASAINNLGQIVVSARTPQQVRSACLLIPVRVAMLREVCDRPTLLVPPTYTGVLGSTIQVDGGGIVRTASGRFVHVPPVNPDPVPGLVASSAFVGTLELLVSSQGKDRPEFPRGLTEMIQGVAESQMRGYVDGFEQTKDRTPATRRGVKSQAKREGRRKPPRRAEDT